MKFRTILIAFKRKLLMIFDLFRNKDYLKTISSEELGFDGSKYHRYSTSDNFYLKKIINYINVGKDDSIIDIGSGKGSVLRFFLKYPFKKIGGLEISEKLIEISKSNLNHANKNQIVHFNEDAKDFNKYDDFNIYYVYNPCSKEIFEGILEKIVSTSSNKKLLIYNNPTCEESVINYGFSFIKEFDSQWGHGIKLFSFTPKEK